MSYVNVDDAENGDVPEDTFQPIPGPSPIDHQVFLWLRCLVNLQLGTLLKNLRPALAQLTDRVVEAGAGQSPRRAWLPEATSYHGLMLVMPMSSACTANAPA